MVAILYTSKWVHTSAALQAFFLAQARQIEALVQSGYDHSDPALRDRLAAQPARRLQELEENLRGKLAEGRVLQRMLRP